jgi:plastocyanin
MRKFTPVGLLLAASLTTIPSSVSAGGSVIRMLDDGTARFSPKTMLVSQGTQVTWRNDGAVQHNATSRKAYPGGFALVANPGRSRSKTFQYAGGFPYVCTLHGGMKGTLRVPVVVSPSAGSNSTRFQVQLADTALPSGWSFEVQRKIGSGSWNTIKNAVTSRTFTYRSQRDGTHYFRARLERGNISHGFSPVDSIRIS